MGTTTTETSVSFGSKANVFVTNFYPYCTPHFCGEGCSSLIMPTSATKQRLVLILTVWNTYSETRLKKAFHVSKATFNFILSRIEHDLQRDTVAEDPIPPEFRIVKETISIPWQR